MNKTCDPMDFGTPMFYAVSKGKLSVVEALHAVCNSINTSCETMFHFKPDYYAARTDNAPLKDKIERIKSSEVRAANMFKRCFATHMKRKQIMRQNLLVIRVQTRIRGFLGRRKAERIREFGRSLEPSLMESSQHTGGGSEERSRQTGGESSSGVEAGNSMMSGED